VHARSAACLAHQEEGGFERAPQAVHQASAGQVLQFKFASKTGKYRSVMYILLGQVRT
jgi:hypothetical protein